MRIRKTKSKRDYSNLTFGIDYDNFNATCVPEFDYISIGKNLFTIETLIHEINEYVLSFLLEDNNFNNKIPIKLNGKTEHLSHLLSPHGRDTLISPIQFDKHGIPKNENSLIDTETQRNIKTPDKRTWFINLLKEA